MENSNSSKRELILSAALEIFSTKGFYSTKIEDIAQQAGIGKGTVYEYFKSKDQLFQEMLREYLTHYIALVIREIDREATAAGKLSALIRNNFKFGYRFRPLARSALWETIPVDDEFRSWLLEIHRQRLKTIERIVREGTEREELRPVDASVFARMFYGAMSFTVSPFMDLEINEDEIEKFAAEIVEYYLKGIGSPA